MQVNGEDIVAILLKDVQENKEINTLVNWANRNLEALGYTEHGPRHVGYVSRTASKILKNLNYSKRMVELAAITGWIHDVGNCINRKNHGLTGANLLFPILRDMGMPTEEICIITSAIGNHEEDNGFPVNEVAAALIIADKSDAHRTRLRKGKYDPDDIHDRVNFAINSSKITVNADKKAIIYQLEIDSSSSVMEFLQIYMSRMVLSEKAANYLGCTFDLVANGLTINNHKKLSSAETA